MVNNTDYLKYLKPEYQNREAVAANYANYNVCVDGFICCGNMELHSDYGYGVDEQQPMFAIRAHFWHSDYVLVVTDDDGDLCMHEPSDEIIEFNGVRLHGFMPRDVASELVQRQDEDGPLYAAFSRIADEYVSPKLVWSWKVCA